MPKREEKKYNSPFKNPYFLVVVFVYVSMTALLLFGGKSMPDEFPATEFDMKDIMGSDERVFYRKSEGRPVVIYFFASW